MRHICKSLMFEQFVLWFDFLVVAVVAVWLQMYQELSVLPPRGYFPESLEFQCPRGCFFFQ